MRKQAVRLKEKSPFFRELPHYRDAHFLIHYSLFIIPYSLFLISYSLLYTATGAFIPECDS